MSDAPKKSRKKPVLTGSSRPGSAAWKDPSPPAAASDAPGAAPAQSGELDFNPDFQRAVQCLSEGTGHVFITGRAGTGKSTLLRHFLAHTKLRAAVLAPTGVAALNVGGQTIHSFFGFKPGMTPQEAKRKGGKPRFPKMMEDLQMVVIDEASMVRADLLDCVDAYLRAARGRQDEPFGGVRMAFIGDLYQLPPVVSREEEGLFKEHYETPYFFSSLGLRETLERGTLELVELSNVYRQKDRRFLDILNTVRNRSLNADLMEALNERARPKPSEWPEDAIHLTATNAQARDVNEARLAALPGRGATYWAQANGSFDAGSYPTGAELTLKPGCAVMFLNNDADGRWVNGSMGKVVSAGDFSILVRMADGGETHEVEPFTWEMVNYSYDPASRSLGRKTVGTFRQLPVFLAWAITVHKSQGKTFRKVVADLSRAFAPGQAYVALSRCTSLEGLFLKSPLSSGSVKLDERIVKFLTDFQRAKARTAGGGDVRAILEAAAAAGTRVRVTYLRDRDEKSVRVLKPISVGEMSYAGVSYLGVKAFCETFQAVRTFKVDNILEIEETA